VSTNQVLTCMCQPCQLLREDKRPFMQAAVLELVRIMNPQPSDAPAPTSAAPIPNREQRGTPT